MSNLSIYYNKGGETIINYNPWYGCKKKSVSCVYCFTLSKYYESKYRDPNIIKRNDNLNYLLEKDKKGLYKIYGNQDILVLNNSDFFLKEARSIREEVYNIFRERQDLRFHIKTKRLSEAIREIPDDIFDLPNLYIEIVVSNQFEFDTEASVLVNSKFKNKKILIYPLYNTIDISKVLTKGSVSLVSVKGLDFKSKIVLKYESVVKLSEDTLKLEIPFNFISTGAQILKDGKIYLIPEENRYHQAFKSKLSHE